MILITGGLGFLGVGTARYLLEQGEEVLLTRRRTSRIPAFLTEYLDKKLKVVGCDIMDLPSLIAVLKEYRVRSIIHAAVVTLAKASLYQGFKINMEGTINVLESARLMGIKRVTLTSSITVYYGIRSEIPYQEAMAIPLDVKYPIACEKIAAETMCNLYSGHYGLDLVITRISMAYGPYSASGFIPMELMVEGAAKEKRAFLSQFHPEYKMDFIYIDDCARAIGMVHLAKELKYKVYNIASGMSHTLDEVTGVIKKVIPDCQIELNGNPPPWQFRGVDISRIHDEFGYRPKYSLEQGIREYIDWTIRTKQ